TLGSGADTFTFVNTDNAPTSLDTGPSTDTVNVQRRSEERRVGSNCGLRTATDGKPTIGVQRILGAATITNPPATDRLNVNDAGNVFARVASHAIDTSTGIATIAGLAPASISYQTNDLLALNITLGSGADTFTFANTDNAPTSLDTGPSNDTVNVQR